MRIALGILFAVLCFAEAAHAELILTVNRYAGMKDFNRSRQSVWIKTQEGYYQKTDAPQLSEQFSCDALLTIHQHFPLAQMVARDYLSEADARMYLNFLKQYDPSQITFIQLTDTDQPRPVSALPDANPLEKFETTVIQPTHASLSLVSGQRLDLKSGHIATTPLPWQLEPKLKETAMKLDRNQYRFVWEWGRAARVVDGIDEILRKAILIQLEELYAFHGTIDDAWVTFHSLDKIHTRAYLKRFPDRTIYYDESGKGEAIFLVPLSEAIQSLHPESQSKTLSELMHAGLGLDYSLQLIRMFKQLENQELDVMIEGKRQSEPAMLLNSSDLQGKWISDVLVQTKQAFRLNSKTINSIHNTLNQIYPDDFLALHPFRQDNVLTPHAPRVFADRNALVLTNLDPKLALQDHEYTFKMLVSVLAQTFHDSVELNPNLRLQEFIEFVIDQKINLAVLTKDLEIARQLEIIPGMTKETAKVSGLDVPDTQEIYQRAIKLGLAKGLQGKEEVTYRYTLSLHALIDLVNVSAEKRSWFNDPTYELDRRIFSIHRQLINLGGSF